MDPFDNIFHRINEIHRRENRRRFFRDFLLAGLIFGALVAVLYAGRGG